MPNVWSAAGGAARSATELSNLFTAARKLISSDNDLPSQVSRDRDVAFTKRLSTQLQIDDANDRKNKAICQYVKIGIAILKMVGSAAAASSGDSKGSSAADNKTAQGAEWASFAITMLQTVISIINAEVDRRAAKEKKTILDDSMKCNDAELNAMDTSGRG